MADLRVVSETGSTNDDMRGLATDGAPEGSWLRAERQTAGRGRLARAWRSEEGNFHASTLVRLRPQDPPPASLAFVAAVAVHDVLATMTGAQAIRLKWPNDIVAGHAKLCGMLLERAGDTVIVGIGINVLTAPELPDRLTTSLRMLGAAEADPAALLRPIADSFAMWLGRWRDYGIEPILRAWCERAHPPGTKLSAHLPDGETVEGAFEALDPEGALILRLADGSRRAIHAGDLFLI